MVCGCLDNNRTINFNNLNNRNNNLNNFNNLLASNRFDPTIPSCNNRNNNFNNFNNRLASNRFNPNNRCNNLNNTIAASGINGFSPVPVCRNMRTFSSIRVPTISRKRRYPPRSINSARIPTGRADDSRNGIAKNPKIKRKTLEQRFVEAQLGIPNRCAARNNVPTLQF